MSEDNFRASAQKTLMSRDRSMGAKYSTLILGRRSLFAIIKFELITLAVSWVPGALGFVLRRIFYPCLLGRVGRNVVFGRGITLRHPHKIRIGDNTVIDDYSVLDAKGEANEGIVIGAKVFIGRHAILSCKEGSISIGDHSNISANCTILSETEVRLGNYCFLAGNCYLVAGGNHSFDKLDVPIMFQPSISKGGIRVGDDVWLGAGVIVLDGVTVGRGSVVGAGSVIPASLPEYSFARAARALKVEDRRRPES